MAAEWREVHRATASSFGVFDDLSDIVAPLDLPGARAKHGDVAEELLTAIISLEASRSPPSPRRRVHRSYGRVPNSPQPPGAASVRSTQVRFFSL